MRVGSHRPRGRGRYKESSGLVAQASRLRWSRVVPFDYGVVAVQAEVSPEANPSVKISVITGAALKSP